jgi:CheY-like chemotaxis protein
LLVQPARDDREMYVLFLRRHGVTTLAASTALEAMGIVPAVDAIVTGISLAGMTDGLEFVRAVRQAVARHISVIVLTAHAYQSDRERAFAAGCDRFLAKPCLPHALLAEIYDVLDQSAITPATSCRRARW